MNIHVHAGYWARRWLNADTADVAFDGNISAIEAVIKSGIPEDEIGPIEQNGKLISPEHELADGDTVRVYAKIIGG